MSVRPVSALAVLTLGLVACASSGGRAAPAAPAAEPAAPAAPTAAVAAAPAPSMVGDWVWSGQINDERVDGTWHLSYANGRWSGLVTMGDQSPAPLGTMSVSGATFQFTADFGSAQYLFRGRMETARTITGTVSRQGGMGRMAAQRR